MKTTLCMLMLVGSLGLGGCATSAADNGVTYTPLEPYSACLDTSRVREWYSTGPKSLIVQAGTDYFRVDLRTRCTGVETGGVIRFKTANGAVGRPRVCGAMGDAVYSDAGIACPIARVTPITKAQFRAAESAATGYP